MQGVYVLMVSRDNTKAGLGYPQHYLIIANQQHVQATKPSVINRNHYRFVTLFLKSAGQKVGTRAFGARIE